MLSCLWRGFNLLHGNLEAFHKFSTHIMDEFSLQEANRFQGEQVVKQESVGVFECTDDASKYKNTRMSVRMRNKPFVEDQLNVKQIHL